MASEGGGDRIGDASLDIHQALSVPSTRIIPPPVTVVSAADDETDGVGTVPQAAKDTPDPAVPASDSLLLVPPMAGAIPRVHSVEIIPPEQLPDIDDAEFDEMKRVIDEDTVVQFKDAWRSRRHLANFLTLNHNFHIFVICMVMVDVVIVLIELILDLELIKDNECRSNSDCPVSHRANSSNLMPIQDCFFNVTMDHCIYLDGKHRCALADTHHDVDPAEVVHYIGIAVLAYFNLEVLVKLFALDIKFFKHKLEVFDAIVVITSLVLDLTIGGEGARESISLLILLRLWRVTRIFNGITLAVEEREKEKRHKLKHEKELALKDVERLQRIVHELKVEIHEWRSRAHVEATYKGFKHADELLPEKKDEPDGGKHHHLHLGGAGNLLKKITHSHSGKKHKQNGTLNDGNDTPPLGPLREGAVEMATVKDGRKSSPPPLGTTIYKEEEV